MAAAPPQSWCGVCGPWQARCRCRHTRIHRRPAATPLTLLRRSEGLLGRRRPPGQTRGNTVRPCPPRPLLWLGASPRPCYAPRCWPPLLLLDVHHIPRLQRRRQGRGLGPADRVQVRALARRRDGRLRLDGQLVQGQEVQQHRVRHVFPLLLERPVRAVKVFPVGVAGPLQTCRAGGRESRARGEGGRRCERRARENGDGGPPPPPEAVCDRACGCGWGCLGGKGERARKGLTGGVGLQYRWGREKVRADSGSGVCVCEPMRNAGGGGRERQWRVAKFGGGRRARASAPKGAARGSNGPVCQAWWWVACQVAPPPHAVGDWLPAASAAQLAGRWPGVGRGTHTHTPAAGRGAGR